MTVAASQRIRHLLISSGIAASVLVGCLVVARAAAQTANQEAAQEAATAASNQATQAATQAAAKAAKELELYRAAQAASKQSRPNSTTPSAGGGGGGGSGGGGGNTPAGSQATAASPFAAEPAALVSVRFPGGTVHEYVNMLRSSATDPVNIAASEELLSTLIPAIDLKNVTLMSALRALGTIGDGAGMIDVRDLSLVGRTGERSGSPVYEVMWVPRRASEEAGVTTYSLFDRLPALTDEDATRMAETLVSAAQQALQMNGGAANWDMKFHRPSRLLLMKGSKGQIEIVSGVVERMTATWARDAYQKVSSNADTDALRKLEQLKAELIKQAEDQRSRMEQYMQAYEARAQEAHKAGAAVPEMGPVDRLRYAAMQDSYQATLARANRLDDQLLTARLGGESSSVDAKLRSLEMRLNELVTFMEKRMGYGK